MLKVQKLTSSRLQNYVSKFKNIFASNRHVLFCVLCEIKVGSDKRFSVVQNLKTDKHSRTADKANKVVYITISFKLR